MAAMAAAGRVSGITRPATMAASASTRMSAAGRHEILRQDLIIGEGRLEHVEIAELVPDRPHEDGDEHTAGDQYDERVELHHWRLDLDRQCSPPSARRPR